MSKHTPGPWQWYWRTEDGHVDCGVFYERREGQAISICRAPRYEKKEQWKANACLIAAAPDLLEACRAALSYHEGGDISRMDMMRKCSEAIAKAEGK